MTRKSIMLFDNLLYLLIMCVKPLNNIDFEIESINKNIEM